MNITLRQLQVFLAVAQTENLTAAADNLFITKGAVSQALHELERQLGVKLFDRIHPHMRLNHEGLRLRPLADEILQRCHEAEHLFQQGTDHYLCIGASKTIGTYILPKMLQKFVAQHQWLPEVHIANTGDLLDLVATFRLDVVLIEGESLRADVVAEKWIDDTMVVLAHKDHPLQHGGPHPPEVLRGQKWILREAHSGTRAFFDHALAPFISPYTVLQSLESPTAVLSMVEQGLGITFTSKVIAALPDFKHRFSIIELTQSFSRTFSLGYHAQKYCSPSMEEFLRFCRRWHPYSFTPANK